MNTDGFRMMRSKSWRPRDSYPLSSGQSRRFERVDPERQHRDSIEEMGDKGLQASAVGIVDKPGSRISEVEEIESEPPPGWEE